MSHFLLRFEDFVLKSYIVEGGGNISQEIAYSVLALGNVSARKNEILTDCEMMFLGGRE